jgi:hypothetical protein
MQYSAKYYKILIIEKLLVVLVVVGIFALTYYL